MLSSLDRSGVLCLVGFEVEVEETEGMDMRAIGAEVKAVALVVGGEGESKEKSWRLYTHQSIRHWGNHLHLWSLQILALVRTLYLD